MAIYKTLVLTEREHKALTDMIARYETGYVSRLRMLGGKGKSSFSRAVAKLQNSHSVYLSYNKTA